MGCAVSSLTVRPVVTLEPDNAKDALRSISFKTGVVTPLNANGFDLKQNVTNEVVEKVNVLRAPYTGSEEDILPCVDPPVDTSHATNNGFDSHQADETGFLYRDVKNIANPKNIIAAVKRGDLQTVKELCDSKIGQESSVNALGMWNSSPLMIATQYAQDEIANFLLNQDDIKIDHVNDNGVSTLLIACSGGNFDIVSRLLDMGVNANPATAKAFFNQQIDKSIYATPLSVAVMNGHYKCVDALLRHTNIVNNILDFPVVISAKNSSNRMTPIMLACLYGQPSVVSVLLAYNANCVLTDSSNSNLLHYTARAGVNAAGVFEVLQAGLEERVLRSLVMFTDVRGYTALHHACLSNQLDIIPILISLGSDVNMRTAPLSESAYYTDGREESLPTSLRSAAPSHSIDINSSDEQGNKSAEQRYSNQTISPTNKSMKSSSDSSNQRISRTGDNILKTAISYFTSSGKEVKENISKNITGNVPQTEGEIEGEGRNQINNTASNTTIINSIQNDKKRSQNMKLNKPSTGSGDVWGLTPLHIAVKKRSEIAVTLLLGKNANPIIKDDNDISPLDLANKLRADSPILLILNKAAMRLSQKRNSDDGLLPPHNSENICISSSASEIKREKSREYDQYQFQNQIQNLNLNQQNCHSHNGDKNEEKNDINDKDEVLIFAEKRNRTLVPTQIISPRAGYIEGNVVQSVQQAVNNIVYKTLGNPVTT